ncbi:unnamed protein product [Rhizoctonia solani]|uniref:Uncharacterized protein n=1 Tax=Rhizoctonia solani TaxID=456999 RepID=A0A8H2WIL2_9AGAM|nr:unnamed protein product [Rhizoctonia solani]
MLLQRLTASDSSPGCSVGSMHTTLKGHLRSNNVLSCLSPEAAMSLFKHHLVLEKLLRSPDLHSPLENLQSIEISILET